MACPQFNKIFQSNETDQLQIKSHGKCFRESLFESNVPIFLLRIGRLSSWFMETWVVLTERPVFNGWYRRPSLDITRPFYMLGISRMTFKLMGDWWVCFNLSVMKDLFPWEQSVSDSVALNEFEVRDQGPVIKTKLTRLTHLFATFCQLIFFMVSMGMAVKTFVDVYLPLLQLEAKSRHPVFASFSVWPAQAGNAVVVCY